MLIIDEINRGHLAKIFGELYFLLEYRDELVNVLYGGEGDQGFSPPRNVILIGTMNTADRSIALVDTAMRRRFWFTELHPDSPSVRRMLARWLDDRGMPDEPAQLLDELNARIEDRDLSYLMRESAATSTAPAGYRSGPTSSSPLPAGGPPPWWTPSTRLVTCPKRTSIRSSPTARRWVSIGGTWCTPRRTRRTPVSSSGPGAPDGLRAQITALARRIAVEDVRLPA